MKRILFSLLLLAATTAYAQGIDSIFVSSPVSELKLIAPNARLDMIDLMAYKMEARGENVYGGYSLLMERSERHLKVRLSEASTWELQLLRQGPDTLYACIYTLFAPAAESRVSLLTTSWKPAAAPAVPAPAYADFFTLRPDTLDADSLELVALRERLEPLSISAGWSDTETDTPRLTFTLSTDRLSVDARRLARRAFHAVSYRFDGMAWRKL